jgi:hypothetical protein
VTIIKTGWIYTIGGSIEVTGRRGRKRKQLLDEEENERIQYTEIGSTRMALQGNLL